MEVSKRRINGNEKKKKKKIKVINDEQDFERTYFESEINYHSTVTKMKVNSFFFEISVEINFLCFKG